MARPSMSPAAIPVTPERRDPIRTATDTALRPIPVFEPDIIAVAPQGELAYTSARNSVHEHGSERRQMLFTRRQRRDGSSRDARARVGRVTRALDRPSGRR